MNRVRPLLSDLIEDWKKALYSNNYVAAILLFNVYINAIFYFIEKCTLYNYADDNTLSRHTTDFDLLLEGLQHDS